MSPDQLAIFQMLLRWVHLVAGVAWIGLLYFFNLVSIPLFRELDVPARTQLFSPLMSRALFWFRYAAMLTVIAGIWYWMMIVGADVRNARALQPGQTFSGGVAIGTFFMIWTLTWWLLSFATAKGRLKLPVVLAIYGVVVTLACLAYLRFNAHGWESNRLLCIGLGGGMGWVMLFNVWGILWRNAKRLIRWNTLSATDGSPLPPEAAALAAENLLVSRANFLLSFPMLFFMGAASHLPLLGN
jgi:uncharacterized membrane protein